MLMARAATDDALGHLHAMKAGGHHQHVEGHADDKESSSGGLWLLSRMRATAPVLMNAWAAQDSGKCYEQGARYSMRKARLNNLGSSSPDHMTHLEITLHEKVWGMQPERHVA